MLHVTLVINVFSHLFNVVNLLLAIAISNIYTHIEGEREKETDKEIASVHTIAFSPFVGP